MGSLGNALFQSRMGSLDPSSHGIERMPQLAQFIVATNWHFRRVVAAFDFSSAREQFLNRDRQASGDKPTQNHGAKGGHSAGNKDFLSKAPLFFGGICEGVH